ncbi:MAG: S8 family serine peptidase [Bdellovibrionales bacterium]|nr:S8 family serine peptidase [Bdellovibrionales bacterium]
MKCFFLTPIKRVFLVLICLSFTACKNKEVQTVFPQESLSCQSTAIKNQYIVHYVDGRRRVYRGKDREQLIRDVVEPELDQIARVDSDQRIFIPQDANFIASDFSGGWGLEASQAAEAWKRGVRGDGIIVAVVDSPIDIDHDLLKNQIAYNHGEIGLDAQGQDRRFNKIDDDGNGYIDDWAGMDFTGTSSDDLESRQHGTHVSGIIAAEHHLNDIDKSPSSTEHPQGVAPGAKILPASFISQGRFGSISDALAAIDYAVAQGAKIINASWGGGHGCSPSLAEKIREIGNKGVLFVAAAGNNGANLDRKTEMPASLNLPLQVTVGSIAPLLGMASHSNYSATVVHIFAPGERINSTFPGNTTNILTGTSMATPFVSGALALLMSAKPDAKPLDFKSALLTGVDINKDYINFSHGRLNILKALEEINKL